MDVSKAVAVVSTSSLIKLLKCKEASLRVDAKVRFFLLSVCLLWQEDIAFAVLSEIIYPKKVNQIIRSTM